MRFFTTLLVASFSLAQNAASAQSTAQAKPHAAAATHTAAPTPSAVHGCVKLPSDLSPKIPALPATAPCAKALYTISTVPTVKLDYVSPEEGPALKEFLGLEGTSFSLLYVDSKVGTGELAAPHKFYSIKYTGYLADGSKFDASDDHGGDPLTFQVGQHQVIPGWDTGFAGMHVGGKRRLYIPFQLAYGPNGRPPAIPARAMLIFDLEFVAQNDKAPEPKAPAQPAKPPADSQPSTPPSGAQPTQGAPTATPPTGTAPASASPATAAPSSTAPTSTPPKTQ